MTQRKGFNFYASYYDVFKQLDRDKDKLSFIEALLDRQFTGVEPNLTGMANFAYISQKHSVDSQVKGWEDKTGCKLNNCTPSQGGSDTPIKEEKGKVKEKEKVQHVVDQFHLLCNNLSGVKVITDKRISHVTARLSDNGIDIFNEVFRKANNSAFLTGDNDRNWKADFDWIINPNNFAKIYEGKYDNKKSNNKPKLSI